MIQSHTYSCVEQVESQKGKLFEFIHFLDLPQ